MCKNSLNIKIATPLALFVPEFYLRHSFDRRNSTRGVLYVPCNKTTSAQLFRKNQKSNIFLVDHLTRYNLELLFLSKLPQKKFYHVILL